MTGARLPARDWPRGGADADGGAVRRGPLQRAARLAPEHSDDGDGGRRGARAPLAARPPAHSHGDHHEPLSAPGGPDRRAQRDPQVPPLALE